MSEHQLRSQQGLGRQGRNGFAYRSWLQAGGMPHDPAAMQEIAVELRLNVPAVTGRTLGENLAQAQNWNPDVIPTRAQPFKTEAGIAVRHVAADELQRRRQLWQQQPRRLASGDRKLQHKPVLQADEGCDMGILTGKRGDFVPRDTH
jgi:dihydroxyacid dehydratase/phosphogluconate dehydratase